jgi:membrane protease YdiL (CAAX protease family)
MPNRCFNNQAPPLGGASDGASHGSGGASYGLRDAPYGSDGATYGVGGTANSCDSVPYGQPMSRNTDMNRDQWPPHMKPTGKRRASVVTFLAPIAFMILHYAVLSVMAFVRVFSFMRVYAAQKGISYGDLMLELKSKDATTELIAKSDAANYASFYTMLIVIPLYLVYLYLRKKRSSSILLTRRVSSLQLLLSLFVIFAAMGLTQLWMLGIQEISQSWPWLMEKLHSYLDAVSTFETAPSSLFFRILVIAILVPIGEELLFRGIVQGEIRRAFGSTAAVIATTLLFAFFHLDVIQSSYVVIAGLVISITYELTEQVAIPMIMHMAFNFIGSGVLSQLMGVGEAGDRIILYVMFGFIFPGIASIFFLKRIHKNKQASEQDAAFPLAKGW